MNHSTNNCTAALQEYLDNLFDEEVIPEAATAADHDAPLQAPAEDSHDGVKMTPVPDSASPLEAAAAMVTGMEADTPGVDPADTSPVIAESPAEAPPPTDSEAGPDTEITAAAVEENQDDVKMTPVPDSASPLEAAAAMVTGTEADTPGADPADASPVIAGSPSEVPESPEPVVPPSHTDAEAEPAAGPEAETTTVAVDDTATDSGADPNADPNAYRGYALAGLRVLIPAAAVAGESIRQIAPEPVAEAPAWLAGYQVLEDRHLAVVDSALLLGLANAAVSPDKECTLVCLHDHAVALALPAAGEDEVIDPAAVTWRGTDSRRQWLAGTLTASKGVLLDIAGIVALVAESVAELSAEQTGGN